MLKAKSESASACRCSARDRRLESYEHLEPRRRPSDAAPYSVELQERQHAHSTVRSIGNRPGIVGFLGGFFSLVQHGFGSTRRILTLLTAPVRPAITETIEEELGFARGCIIHPRRYRAPGLRLVQSLLRQSVDAPTTGQGRPTPETRTYGE